MDVAVPRFEPLSCRLMIGKKVAWVTFLLQFLLLGCNSPSYTGMCDTTKQVKVLKADSIESRVDIDGTS